jgi:hypothetical protein
MKDVILDEMSLSFHSGKVQTRTTFLDMED